MPLLNQKGFTLIENSVAIFFLAILALMVFSALLSGSDLTLTARDTYTSRTQTYNYLEQGVDPTTQSDLTTHAGSITFEHYVDSIPGDFITGDGDDQVSAFVPS